MQYMTKRVYIHKATCISPQNTFNQDIFSIDEYKLYQNEILTCIDVDYKKYINPVQIRRMSRALKIGFSCAMQCIQDIKYVIDGIIIGTGKGCMSETEAFLHSIKQYDEETLNPTPFIHSTYNQLNGMIALQKKINSYNNTYVHRGFSFESSLIDAMLLIKENEANHVLCGSFDEMTNEHYLVKKKWGYWKNELIENTQLFNKNTIGTIAGEGSGFFILGNEHHEEKQVSLLDVNMLYNITDVEIESKVLDFLEKNNTDIKQIDLLISGNSGNILCDIFNNKIENMFAIKPIAYFKHLCGEYDTASQFALWIANEILIHQYIPDILYKKNSVKKQSTIKQVLIYNNYFNINQSLLLLSFT